MVSFAFKFQSHYRSDFNKLMWFLMNYLKKYFNPIIGLILTQSIISRVVSWVFQSHYRSDFNSAWMDVQCLQGYFNPIIGLILTCFNGYYEIGFDDFNPIIGLILTLLSITASIITIVFQSHYRSDFNFLT